MLRSSLKQSNAIAAHVRYVSSDCIRLILNAGDQFSFAAAYKDENKTWGTTEKEREKSVKTSRWRNPIGLIVKRFESLLQRV